MNKLFIFIFCSFFVFLTACKNDPAATNGAAPAAIEHASPQNLAGHWIALDFCARANQYGSVLAAMNNAHLPYVYGISFNPDKADSVTCYNGAKTWKLAASINVDTIELKNAAGEKSVFLAYDPTSKEITLFDVTTGEARMDRFVKSKANSPNGYLAFTTALNHNLLEGNFYLVGKKDAAAVQFTPGGYINNLSDYDRYTFCTNGDCFVMGDKMDIIHLASTKIKDSIKKYGFKYSTQGDTLSIYNLKMSPEGTTAEQGGIAYRFLRKSVNEKIKK